MSFARTARRLLGIFGSALLVAGLSGCSYALMDPHGPIGRQEKLILIDSTVIMLAIVIPVIIATLAFAWWYRAGNANATRHLDWSYSGRIEFIVWAIPALVILFLGGIAWISAHDLDPPKALESSTAPLDIEVVALNWKWLFIYPDYGIASVNRLEIPVGTPIDFTLTSGSIMNSFFIPQLGSQIYAMAGMQTQLHLIADSAGTYAGLSSAFSGPGFSDMHFDAVATGRPVFDAWVQQAKASPLSLDQATYQVLAQPSTKNPVAVYAHVAPGLFENVVNQYMPAPMEGMAHMASDPMTATGMPHGMAQRSQN